MSFCFFCEELYDLSIRFLLVAQDVVLGHRAGFQLIIYFFRVKAISTGLII